MSALTFDSLVEQTDLELGTGRWMTVDQKRIDAFAEITEDPQWIHVDTERAAAGPFGSTIAHGYLTMSLIAPVLNDLFVVDGAVAEPVAAGAPVYLTLARHGIAIVPG